MSINIKNIGLGLAVYLCILTARAQHSDYAHSIINELASETYQGRGYVKNGDHKAAQFIAQELKKHGLSPKEQSFHIAVNTFPGNAQLSFDEHQLKPGVDYLFAASSSALKGRWNAVYADSSTLNDPQVRIKFQNINFSNRVVVLDTVGLHIQKRAEFSKALTQWNALEAKAVILVVEKLPPYSISPMANAFPLVYVTRAAFAQKPAFVSINLQNKFKKNYKTQNIYAKQQGKCDSLIVFTAHYDHLGRMGDEAYFPGAHDNASGVAAVLDLAHYYASKKPHYSMAFVFFSAEEAGLLGSSYFAAQPPFPLGAIKQLVNLDLIGSGEEGITIVNGAVHTAEFDGLVRINQQKKYLASIQARGVAANSDHYPFHVKGVKSFFIYTRGAYKE